MPRIHGVNGTAPDMAPIPGRGAMSKVEKFGWTIQDAPGTFMMLSKHVLKVDHDYQRDNVNNDRVLCIAAEWSWVACGALIVADRGVEGHPDYWVCDGQHRKSAADKRSDIEFLPCLVFGIPASESKKEEARAYLRVNTNRGHVQTLQKFKAQTKAEEEIALAVRDMVEDSGYTIGSGGYKTVACVYALTKEMSADPVAAETVWKLLVRVAASEEPRINPIQDRAFKGLCHLERVLKRKGFGSVADPIITKAIIKAGTEGMDSAMSKAVGYHGKSGSKIWAEGLVMMINRGRRTFKMPSMLESSRSAEDESSEEEVGILETE